MKNAAHFCAAFFTSKQRRHPMNNPINHTRHRAVDDDRPGDLEHVGADTENKALCWCSSRTQCFLSKQR